MNENQLSRQEPAIIIGEKNEQEIKEIKLAETKESLVNLDLSTVDGLEDFKKKISSIKDFSILSKIFPFASDIYNIELQVLHDLRCFDYISQRPLDRLPIILAHSELGSLYRFNESSVFLKSFSKIIFCIEYIVLEINYNLNYTNKEEIFKKVKEIMATSKEIFVKYISNKLQDFQYDFNTDNPLVSTSEIELWFNEVYELKYKNMTRDINSPRIYQSIVNVGAETLLERLNKYQKALQWTNESMSYAKPKK